MTVLEELQSAIQAAAEQHRTGGCRARARLGRRLGHGDRTGSGADQRTQPPPRGDDRHVPRRPAGDRQRLPASDSDLDIAVIEVDTGDIEPVQWRSEADAPAIGRAVLALGNPGGRGLRVTPGFVSSTARSFRGPRGRRITGAIEHTAPLPRGSSGGPLVDTGRQSARHQLGPRRRRPDPRDPGRPVAARPRRGARPRRAAQAGPPRRRDRAAARGQATASRGRPARARRRAGARRRGRQPGSERRDRAR